MASNSDRARMVGSNFDRVRIVVVGDAGNTSEPMTRGNWNFRSRVLSLPGAKVP